MSRIARFIFISLLILFGLEAYFTLTDANSIFSYATNLALGRNFHTVIPDKLYRSGELSYTELKSTIKNLGIKSVIDLRLGAAVPDKQGLTEREIVHSSGVSYFNVRLNEKITSKARLTQLFAAFDQAQTPLLIHCTSGTQRAGIAAAIWLLDKEGQKVEQAATQFAPRYGYFRLERQVRFFLTGTKTIDALFWEYLDEYNKTQIDIRSWLGEGDIQRTGDQFS